VVRSHLMPVIIAGPTASGKSALAMKWALEHEGEIICADSRQFYAGMSIGTAAPCEEDLKKVVHHGYGIIDPHNQKIDAGFFVSFARKKILEVQQHNKRPIVVGGTGLYLRSLYYGISDVPASDPKLTAYITQRCDALGLDASYAELKNLDPETASGIEPKDRYRISRALEIYYLTGQKPSELRVSFAGGAPKLVAHWIYKKPAKEALLKSLKDRVVHMFANGLVDEALQLKNRLAHDHWALKVMGYQEALLMADGAMTLEQAIERTFIRHRQYAKRQYTWFNKEQFYRFVIG
jgi:tRNA dimethylallyltransferase